MSITCIILSFQKGTLNNFIKITLGIEGSSVICISFHLAEHKMQYPLK